MVTGVAGFVGSSLALELLRRGHEVFGVDKLSTYYAPELKRANLASLDQYEQSLEIMISDLNDLPASSFAGLDGIFHLAAQAGVRSSWGEEFTGYLSDNLQATQKVFESASLDCPIVYASSSSVYGDAEVFPTKEGNPTQPRSPYGVTKAACEMLARAYSDRRSASTSGLRYFTVYGPHQRPDMAFTRICFALLTNGEFPLFGDGSQVRDFTFVDDAVTATIGVLDSEESGVFNVGGGHQISMLHVIELFEEVSGRRLQVRHLDVARGDVRRTGADRSKLHAAIGWLPSTNIKDGIAKQWEWAVTHQATLEKYVTF